MDHSPADFNQTPPAETDTIVALSTAAGVGAIGIVRLSGPDSFALGRRVFRPLRQGSGLGESHRLHYGHVVDPDNGEILDEVLFVLMQSPATYTREDVVEVHCHGGAAAQRAVLQLLLRLGARPAEPGEFTRRAFLNGRLDLAQAESVAAVVRARSASALRAALNQLQGGLSGRLRELRGRLVAVLAQLEATIDFSEEDVDDLDRDGLAAELGLVEESVERLLSTALLGRALDQGIRTAIVGKPNVGKSSLLNALLMRERAIVSEIPGTTRDTIEELVEVGGIPLHLVDTAGIRRGADAVERLGIERSRLALETADLSLAVLDCSTPLDEHDLALLGELDPSRTIVVGNKEDLAGDGATEGFRSALPSPNGTRVVTVSAHTGAGLDELRASISEFVLGEGGLQLDEPLLANERQRRLVEEALGSVRAARQGLSPVQPEELVCDDLRTGVSALGRITGEELVPDLIEEIFRRFCIGK